MIGIIVRSRTVVSAAIVHILTTGVAGQSGTPAPNERLLGEIAGRPHLIQYVVSPDGRRVAWKAGHQGKEAVFVNGTPGPGFDQIDGLRFSPDSSRVAWNAKVGNRWRAIMDGTAIAGEFDYVETPVFLLDGRVAYVARAAKNRRAVMIDGQEQPLAGSDIMLSPVPVLAFASRQPDGWHVSTATARLGPFREVRSIVPSLIGGRVAVSTRRSMIIDGSEGSTFDRVHGLFIFSANGKRTAYVGVEVTRGRARGRAVIDGQPGPLFEDPNGDPEGGTGGVTIPAFSPDGSRVIYAAYRGKDDVVIVVDGSVVPDLPMSAVAFRPTFVSNDEWIAVGRTGTGAEARVAEVRNGKVVATFPMQKGVSFVEHLTISPDRTRVAYVLGQGGALFLMESTVRARRQVVIDGAAGEVFDADELTDLTFSADSSRLAYRVRNGTRDFVVTSGRSGRRYHDVFPGSLRFAEDGTLSYLARDDRRLLEVTEPR